MTPSTEAERLMTQARVHGVASDFGVESPYLFTQDELDALLDAVRRDERDKLATGLDTRAEALAHVHGVAGNIDGMSDEEFERRVKAAGKGCTVCARIELLSECAAALRAGEGA